MEEGAQDIDPGLLQDNGFDAFAREFGFQPGEVQEEQAGVSGIFPAAADDAANFNATSADVQKRDAMNQLYMLQLMVEMHRHVKEHEPMSTVFDAATNQMQQGVCHFHMRKVIKKDT